MSEDIGKNIRAENIGLSPELLKALLPTENIQNPVVKFDDAGTMHILSYSNDGQLLKDFPIKEETTTDSLPNVTNDELLNHIIEKAHRKTSISRMMLIQVLFITILSMLSSFLYMYNLPRNIQYLQFLNMNSVITTAGIALVDWVVCIILVMRSKL